MKLIVRILQGNCSSPVQVCIMYAQLQPMFIVVLSIFHHYSDSFKWCPPAAPAQDLALI